MNKELFTLEEVMACLEAQKRGDIAEVRRIVESKGLVWIEGEAIEVDEKPKS